MTFSPFFRTAQTLVASAMLAACASAPPATVPRSIVLNAATCPQPAYPAEARQHEAAGTTELEFEVNPLGAVTRVAIVKSSGSGPGHRVLDTAALETIRKCNFPAAPGFLSASSKVAYVWRMQD
jgi:TonB family protein